MVWWPLVETLFTLQDTFDVPNPGNVVGRSSNRVAKYTRNSFYVTAGRNPGFFGEAAELDRIGLCVCVVLRPFGGSNHVDNQFFLDYT